MLQVRKENGFDKIRLVCPSEHYLIIQQLHNFTRKLLKLAGTGDLQGLLACFDHPLSHEFAPMLKLERPLMRSTLMGNEQPLPFRVDVRRPASAAAPAAAVEPLEDISNAQAQAPDGGETPQWLAVSAVLIDSMDRWFPT